ncbi:MAG: RelA/SpoT family protein [Halothiobacillaceae bacterium]
MKHQLDTPANELREALLAAAPDCPQLPAACDQAVAVDQGDPRQPRGLRAALVLREIGADCRVLTLAVLGDPRLRDQFDRQQIARAFDETLADLVEQLHALNRFSQNQLNLDGDTQAENLRRLIMSLVRDPRVLLVKLVYRLERLRALPRITDPGLRRRVARETLDLYAPLAHRLGLGQIKWELEDLAFRHLEPETYRHMAELIEERRADREAYIEAVREQLRVALEEAGIQARIHGRPKHLYSIFNKMKRKRLPFERLFDLRALRVHVDSVADCYAALSVVQSLWLPIPGEYDDYIANPKPNGYQSLHAAVQALEGKTLEVQIRTEQMHERAELGVAAHWRYKEGSQGGVDPFQEAMERLRKAMEDGETPELDLARIYVFTPRKEIIELPRGATPLDLAYRLHSDLGHRTRGARVNGRLVPLTTVLNSADTVEILTGSEARPRRDWADPDAGYLTTRRARKRVRDWFRVRQRESAQAAGRTTWDRLVRRLGLDRTQQETLRERLGARSLESVFELLGEHRITREQLLSEARSLLRPEQSDLPPLLRQVDASNRTRALTLSGLLARPASCCHPGPGDAAVAFVTRTHGLKLHRPDCPNLRHLAQTQPERILPVEIPSDAALPHYLRLQLTSEPPGTEGHGTAARQGLMRDLALALGQFKARLLSQRGRLDRRSGLWRMELELEVPDRAAGNALVARLAELPDVHDVRRQDR